LLGKLGLAHAEAPTTTALPPIDRLVEQAVAQLGAGNPQDALLVLQRAAFLNPTSARVRVHLAAVHQALDEWIAAEEQLLFALDQSDDAYVAQHREALDEALQSIQSHLSRLTVTGEPAGAEVFLDGHRLGTLPLATPIRVVSGAHVLRISANGYRAYSGSIETVPDVPSSQVVHLEAEDRRAFRALPHVSTPVAAPDESASSDHWLTWSLAGVGGAALVATAAAFTVREVHAGHWNSQSCLEPGRTRAEVCRGERAQVETWQALTLGTGIAAAALLGGALLSWSLETSTPDEAVSLSECSMTWGQLGCRGRF
jgi:hypothetical protein